MSTPPDRPSPPPGAPSERSESRGEAITVRVHALAAGGDAVGKDDGGRAVFVSGGAPGDVLRARLVETHARWARGELVDLVTPGSGRVEPPCPLFAARACGGCQWQHVDAATQHGAKQALLAGALRKLIAEGLTLRPLLTPVAPYGWRRRARWSVQRGAIGYHAPRGHAVCDVPACPQLEPALEAVLLAIRAANAGDGVDAHAGNAGLGGDTRGGLRLGDGEIAGVDARGGLRLGDGEIHAVVGEGGAAHVVFDAPVDPAAAAALVGRAGIAGVAWRGGAAGVATVELEAGLAVRGDDFAQAARDGNLALRALVREAMDVRPGERILELHAGGGNFTRDLIAAGANVTPTDAHAPSAPPPGFVCGTAAEVVAAQRRADARFDAILLDPPRTGAREVAEQLGALADRVVYVSCDPATFARDAAHLAASGLRPRWAQGLDLMPQTSHVELVARFERG